LGSSHPETAAVYHNLGGLEHARGRHAAGERFARRSIEIREKALGPEHVDVAADLGALAALLDGQRKFTESEPLYRRAIGIFERVHGPDHFEIGMAIGNLAALKQAQGKLAAAAPLYRRALEIKERHLGGEHPSVGCTLNNMAVLALAQGDDGQARALFARALAILEPSLGAGHPNVVRCRASYRACYLNSLPEGLRSNDSSSRCTAPRTLELKRRHLGPPHRGKATKLNSIAVLAQSRGDSTAAETSFAEALSILEPTDSPAHASLAACRRGHGAARRRNLTGVGCPSA
jgi:tetratricopeptide (TPR) repeat protein